MSKQTTPLLAAVLTPVATLGAAPDAQAQDSFFDVWVDAVDDGRTWNDLQLQNPPIVFPRASGGFDTEMISMDLSSSAPLTVTDLGSNNFQVDSFFDIEYFYSPPGQTNFQVDSFFDVEYSMRFSFDPASSSSTSQTWDTEILSMDLVGSNPAPTNLSTLRLDTARRHTGHVTVLKIAAGPPGEEFQVDSFFDIWTEISLDGGATWDTAEGSSQIAQFTTGVPEPTSLALLGMGGLLVTRRRR